MSFSGRRLAFRSTASSICGRSVRLVVAPGFSKDRSLMYWATTCRFGRAGWPWGAPASGLKVPSLLMVGLSWTIVWSRRQALALLGLPVALWPRALPRIAGTGQAKALFTPFHGG